jgi:hypothetical protein
MIISFKDFTIILLENKSPTLMALKLITCCRASQKNRGVTDAPLLHNHCSFATVNVFYLLFFDMFQILLHLILFVCAFCSVQAKLPIVLWHGMGDTCCNPISIGAVQKVLKDHYGVLR